MNLKTCFLLFALVTIPLVARPAHAQTLIEVEGYGAYPDDGNDDLPGIRAAIAALPPSGGILRFETGIYDIYPRQTLGQPNGPGLPQKWIFTVEFKTDTVIEGNGATLLCHEFLPDQPINASYFNLFNISNCTDFEIRDLTVNMSRLPYTIGQCTKINYVLAPVINRSFQVWIAPSFLPATGNLSTMTMHALMNWRNGAPNGQGFFHIQSVPQTLANPDFYVSQITGTSYYDIRGRGTATGSNPGYVMLTQLADPSANPQKLNYPKLQVGDEVVILHQFGSYITFYFVDCTRSFMSNVTVHSWPGMAVNMLRDTDVVIDGLQVVPDPQRPWPISITHDAIHLANLSGTVQVAGCLLEGMMDDGFNSYTNLLTKHAVVGNTVIELNPKFIDWDFPASTVWEFYDSSMTPLGTRVLSAQSTNLTKPDRHRLVFASLPTPTSSIAYVCNLNQFPTQTELTGTTVRGNRGKGFLLRRDTTVTGCQFDHVSGSGIAIGPLVGMFNEGPGGVNVLVDNSSFRSCNRGYGFYDRDEGAVSIATYIYAGGAWSTGPFGSITGMTLTGLEILDSGGSALTVRSADQVSISNCYFGSSGDLGYLLTPQPTPGYGQWAAESLLFFRNAGNITISNNALIPGSTIFNGDRQKAPMYGTYYKVGNDGF